MEGFHAPVEDLRRSGKVAHRDDRDAGGAERLGSAAGGEDLDAEGMQPAGELDQTRLVADADQRAFDRRHATPPLVSLTFYTSPADALTRGPLFGFLGLGLRPIPTASTKWFQGCKG